MYNLHAIMDIYSLAATGMTIDVVLSPDSSKMRCRARLHVKEMLAGGVAGVAAKTAVAPLDRVKLLRQVGGGAAPAGTSAFRTLLEITRREGPRGLYRGNGINALRVFPSKAIHFMAYEQYRSWLLGAVPSLGGGPVVDLLAGSAAGGTALLATYPLDLAHARLAGTYR